MGRYVLVRVKGLEPPLPYGKQILSLPRLPFRHTRINHLAAHHCSSLSPSGARHASCGILPGCPGRRKHEGGVRATSGNRVEPGKYLTRM